jgi:hypothetical protein
MKWLLGLLVAACAMATMPTQAQNYIVDSHLKVRFRVGYDSSDHSDDYIGTLGQNRYSAVNEEYQYSGYPGILFEQVEAGTFYMGPYQYPYRIYEADLGDFSDRIVVEGITHESLYCFTLQRWNSGTGHYDNRYVWPLVNPDDVTHTFYKLNP